MNKELLINFLNALLSNEIIKEISFLSTDYLGTQEYDRQTVFDVYCENNKGEKIQVEIQGGKQQLFKSRSAFLLHPNPETGLHDRWG